MPARFSEAMSLRIRQVADDVVLGLQASMAFFLNAVRVTLISGDLVHWKVCCEGISQFGLVSFDGQQVIRTLIKNLQGNLLLTSHGINGNQAAMQVKQF